MLCAADRGIRGNSHMIMQDKNNLQIADLILKWIDERVRQAERSAQSDERHGYRHHGQGRRHYRRQQRSGRSDGTISRRARGDGGPGRTTRRASP